MYDIYLAAPFFNEEEIEIYNRAIERLRAQGYKVFVPKEHEIPNAWKMSNREWAKSVYTADFKAIEQSKIVVALNFGMYSDSGTAWEMGYATALNKTVVQVLCGDDNTVYSLMALSSADMVTDILNIGVWNTIDLDKVIQK